MFEYKQYQINIFSAPGAEVAEVYLDGNLAQTFESKNKNGINPFFSALDAARQWIDAQNENALATENAALRGRVAAMEHLLLDCEQFLQAEPYYHSDTIIHNKILAEIATLKQARDETTKDDPR